MQFLLTAIGAKLLETSPIGDYIVRIAVEDEVYESVISHATKTQILDLLNAAKNSEEVLKLIELYNDVYLLPVSENDLFAKIGDVFFTLDSFLAKDTSSALSFNT